MRTGTRERLAGKEEWSMKIFRKLLLALLVLAALRVPCFAQEAFHGAYLQGFPDGSIRPEKQVTRAELAEILNRILGRTPQSLSDLLVGMPLFSDNLDTEAPYFLAMQEAAIDHTACVCGDGERWTGLG